MRTIILLLDWDSTLFWRDTDGCESIDEATLPISDDLKHRLSDYYKHYSELYYLDTSSAVPDIEKRLLDDTGFEIWQRLRSELSGIYRIIFHSQEFGHSFESPDDFLASRKEAYS